MKKLLTLSLSSLFLILGLVTQANAQTDKDFADNAKYSAAMDVILTKIIETTSVKKFYQEQTLKYKKNIEVNKVSCFAEDSVAIFAALDKLKTSEIKDAVNSICEIKVLKFRNQYKSCESNCLEQRILYNKL